MAGGGGKGIMRRPQEGGAGGGIVCEGLAWAVIVCIFKVLLFCGLFSKYFVPPVASTLDPMTGLGISGSRGEER